ncbi:hypothetical protein BVJ53_06200 [Lacticaseibacillus chiayiensis]|uniref:DUF1149 family protein n=1 Tax=Lacticaseibacillus chiayiensis TaxID=2100821 RepID=A0A4Q1U204_9LACO|nr:DUF1149 family protein [Lacticaseibacillus chiayiensis]QVI35429.1 DUF1149 family protein [Lacticaseibacillus chiayiensis]RXT25536.1 hypothetical protein BVJ53_06200 [Lacticaseibacillus chiayiensis]UYN57269.1 DUF1149 family protein [Lacticaseibacillus chiayiensis]
MEAKRYPITVESFHYDLVKQDTPVKNDLQVAMRQIQWSDPKRQEELKKGNLFEMMIPFDVVPDNSSFEISGKITQIVQVMDYFGEANELPQEELGKLSRPLVETIETLTYQVTAVALDQGVNLQFGPNEEQPGQH